MDMLTDTQLIGQYLEGNQKAFETIINRYAQPIFRFTYKLTNNKDTAHDITQETIIKLWKNIKKFDTSKNIKAWLFTIAKNTTLDYLRKNKNLNFSDLNNTYDSNDDDFAQNIEDSEPLQFEIFEKNENIEMVQKALETLSVENKMIVLLKNGEEMTFDEIATVVEKPMNSVKSQYRRSLISLKKYIENSDKSKMHQN
jgi:RNA polymerase sigma-70 factor (ECF subfamily)